MMCHAGFGGVDTATGEYTCFLETFGGGYGGRAGSDGPDAVQTHGQNTENAPVEETERGYPVHIDQLSLVEDSDGPGRFRGGLGLRKDYRFDRPLTFTVLADRTKQGPWGVLGGGPGAPARFVLVRDGVEQDLNPKSTVDLLAGDVVSYRTCGGGGYGPATERDPALVLRDVLEGKVSAQRARDLYRVAIDTAGRVDAVATAALRAESRRSATTVSETDSRQDGRSRQARLGQPGAGPSTPRRRKSVQRPSVDESTHTWHEGHLTKNGL